MQGIATRYLFIDMAVKNLELDMQLILSGSFKIKEPYIHIVGNALSKAKNERKHLKKLMYDNKMQVLFMHRQGNFSTYKFILGDNVREETFMNQVIKKNVEEIMKEMFEGE